MNRQHLTDNLIQGLALAPASDARYEIHDASVENLAVRIGAKKKSFVVAARFVGPDGNTAKRKLGHFPEMTVQDARVAAHDWNEQVRSGIDPAIQAAAEKEAENLRLRSTFASVMADYIAEIPSRKRNLRADEDIKFLKRNFLNPGTNPWMHRPIYMVTDEDVEQLIKNLRGRAPVQALQALKKIRQFFRWAMQPSIRKKVGLKINPAAELQATILKLSSNDRSRVFEYEEARAYLMAASATPYPYGPCSRALIETAQRIGAVSAMRWSQINFERKLWTIPGARSISAVAGRTSKSDGSLAVPLSNRMVEMLRSLKQAQLSDHGDYVFSFTNGQTPISSNFSNLKRNEPGVQPDAATDVARGRFERLVRRFLADAGFEYEPWVWHDVRRTTRTHLEPITGREEVAEAAIGHTKTGVVRVYNLHKYRAEIRRAFNIWSDMLVKVEQGTCTIADWEHDAEAS